MRENAIFWAILQLLSSHLLWKIPTVFFAGVGQFLASHDRAVPSGRVVETLHDATPQLWKQIYLKIRFGVSRSSLTNRNLSFTHFHQVHTLWLLMADNVRRALQNINLGIDDAPFSLPAAIVQQAADDNRYCLMGRPLMPRKQNLRQILTSLPRSWGLVGFVRGRIVEQRRFQFIFPSEESLETVLRRGPWSFADRMLVLQRWTPDLDPLDLNFIPFWIQIRGIPLQYLNIGVIDSIAGSLGEKMEADFDENAATRVQFVRVRIKWNVDQPLRFQRNYQFAPGVNTVLSFFYERLRGFCEVCGMMTHDSGRCLIQNGGPPGSEDDDDDGDDGDHGGHGNPGVQIQELGEDGEPIVDMEDMEEEHPQVNPNDEALVGHENLVGEDNNVADEELTDIDPEHNALEGYSTDHPTNMTRDDWISENAELLNPIPSFVDVTGTIPGPVELLARELRKRKHGVEPEEDSSSQKQKTESMDPCNIIKVEEGSGSGSNLKLTEQDRAAVGPVPPPVP